MQIKSSPNQNTIFMVLRYIFAAKKCASCLGENKIKFVRVLNLANSLIKYLLVIVALEYSIELSN